MNSLSHDKDVLLSQDAGSAPFPGEVHFLLFRETETSQRFLFALPESQASPIRNDQYAIVGDYPEPQP